MSVSHYVAPSDEVEIAAARPTAPAKGGTLFSDAWLDLRRRPTFWLSMALIALILFVALFPGLITSVPPNAGCQLANSNGAPVAGHPLGFTKQGCDVFSRIVHGAGTSVSVGLIATLLMAVLGIVFGALAGFYGGWVDTVLSRVGDQIFFSIPYILAAVVIMSVFAAFANVWIIALAIGIFAWPATARVLRAEVMRVRNADFVMASEALGLGRFRILVRHVLPNSIAPVIVITTISLAGAIVAEATLSFLGGGLPPSTMSWGNDISAAQVDLRTAPTVLLYPSIALSVTVLSFILLGETVREALDPKARARR
ncbi:ABC transporter permease [Leifsonia xyli subsp. cynodontis DSM 46306]|uniref:ABC transmembrane type-1 domain-containing protein n=1 Tax=Leifsonia xyli subsp. cynodontis DSM 46306 TaxID=1389489 RepID=U3P8U6_LEIXC|nr:ABC transporter permease [Leifsonia xyli]AGW41904.1 ABC transporter permease [Leifsonia xyli subsp. cynodontis DSM 46306]